MAISKLNVGGNSYDLRDAASMHYIGHATAGITESSGVYTSQGLTDISVTIKVNDFITYGTENLNYVCTDVTTAGDPAVTTQTWALISESTAENALSNIEVNGVTGTVNNHVASVTLYAKDTQISSDASTATADNTLPAGILTGNLSAQSADGALANKKYVDDSIANIPSPMIFKGTAGTAGDFVPDDAETGTKVPAASSTGSSKNTGWTIKIITDGTYAGVVAKEGDVIVSTGTIWSVIPSGDEPDGTVTGVATDVASGSNLTLKAVDNTTGRSTISTSGTITVGVAQDHTIPANTDITAWNNAVTKVADYTAQNNVVTNISNTDSTGTATSVAIGEVGTGADAETLFINPLYVTSDDSAVFNNAT